MLAELSKTMATAEIPPPQKLLRLVSVGSASPRAINIKTAIRKSIKRTSWTRLLRRVFWALIRKKRSVLNGMSLALCRLIMCKITGMPAARAAVRKPRETNVMACCVC